MAAHPRPLPTLRAMQLAAKEDPALRDSLVALAHQTLRTLMHRFHQDPEGARVAHEEGLLRFRDPAGMAPAAALLMACDRYRPCTRCKDTRPAGELLMTPGGECCRPCYTRTGGDF